ncbi:MAG: DUF429 domain-containing protein [Bacillota bacterium]
MSILGVDGCRAGWFAVAEDQNEKYIFNLYHDFKTLWQKNEDKELILVDIPIGLKETGPEGRECDRKVRSILSKRRSSIFPTPCRQALRASSWQEANRINKEVCGKGLSKQTWGITKKIAEVDELLECRSKAVSVIKESHPEILFWALNGRKEMNFNKKETAGYQERLEVITSWLPEGKKIAEKVQDNYFRKDVARDDIIDALVLFLAARLVRSEHFELKKIPEKVKKDPRGIRMEIVFPHGKSS